MKRNLLLLVALFIVTALSAQVEVVMDNLFTISEKYIDLNGPSTIKDGIIFIGDTRTPDKIEDGKYKGMRVQKQGRYYQIGGKAVKFGSSLSFRRAPQGSTVEHKVDVERVPRSCMIQLKPASDGKLAFCAITNKDTGNNIYVAVVNGITFTPLATIAYQKGDENYARKKDQPAEVKSVDYKYIDGDELWIYSDGGINLHSFTFSGKIDKAFQGTAPVATANKINKERKQK